MGHLELISIYLTISYIDMDSFNVVLLTVLGTVIGVNLGTSITSWRNPSTLNAQKAPFDKQVDFLNCYNSCQRGIGRLCIPSTSLV
jgi:hypothetical protein